MGKHLSIFLEKKGNYIKMFYDDGESSRTQHIQECGSLSRTRLSILGQGFILAQLQLPNWVSGASPDTRRAARNLLRVQAGLAVAQGHCHCHLPTTANPGLPAERRAAPMEKSALRARRDNSPSAKQPCNSALSHSKESHEASCFNRAAESAAENSQSPWERWISEIQHCL